MKHMTRNVLALGASVSLIALTGCGITFGGAGEGEGEPEANESSESVEDVPALSDIADVMWDSMRDAGTVTLSADVNDLLGEDAQNVQLFEEMSDGGASEIQFYGSLKETATGMRIGDQELMRNFGDDGTYVSGDAIFNLLGNQNLGLTSAEQQQFDEIAAEFSDTWVDYSSEMQSDGSSDEMDLGVLFDELQQSWEGEDADVETPVDRDEISDEGTYEARDGQDVWVYTGNEEGQELVIEADHDAPKFVSVSEEGNVMSFTDWGATEAPEQPDESQIMTEQEMEQQLTGAGSSDSSLGGNEPMTEPTEPDTAPEPTAPDTTESEPESTSGGTVNVPGAGSINCDGPVVGDPGFSDPNGNYTEEQKQAIQEACGR